MKGIPRHFSWALFLITVLLPGCSGEYRTFADRPGFSEYYRDQCAGARVPVADHDRELLYHYRPRFVLPPGGSYPVDFYRDYIPYTRLKAWPERHVITDKVTRKILLDYRSSRSAYLDFDLERYKSDGLDRRSGTDPSVPLKTRKPVIYGRVYRETVSFPDGKGGLEDRMLIFLKYNLIFPTSGLPADLSLTSDALVLLSGLDRMDWHELDNFVAVHVVLDVREEPMAVILAQHNHHRTYLLGRDLPAPGNDRLTFDIALRSNEVYPASSSPVSIRHRVIRWDLYLDYLLSGDNGPILKAYDVTWGEKAGGSPFDYDLKFLSPCDPLYTSGMLLGEPRPFLGMYLGRDGPPGSDYYTTPELLPLGNLLKFSYLHEGEPSDIQAVRRAVDRGKKTIDIELLVEYGGRRFLEDWKALQKGRRTQGAGRSEAKPWIQENKKNAGPPVR